MISIAYKGHQMSEDMRKAYQLPGNVQVAANAAKAVVQTIRHAVQTGHVYAPQDEIDRRAAICQKCEKYFNGACTACGCNARLKVRLAGMRCPLNPPKWNKIETT